jgi:hypothetical protein
MKHDFIIIDNYGKLCKNTGSRRDMIKFGKMINKQKLQVSRIIMSEQDFQDIVKWTIGQ